MVSDILFETNATGYQGICPGDIEANLSDLHVTPTEINSRGLGSPSHIVADTHHRDGAGECDVE